jgi:hypothetical protein
MTESSREALTRALREAEFYRHETAVRVDKITALEAERDEAREDADRLVWAMDQGHIHGTAFIAWVLQRGGTGDIDDCRTFIDSLLQSAESKGPK